MEDDMWREVSNPYAAIGWIREELNNLLRQVRIGLEAAAEENDLSLLENAEDALEKLHLTLEMLRSPGASLLANEMRVLLGELRNEQIDETKSALVALMQGLVIGDTYLDRLQAGGSDMPLLLLPTINDMRAVRNQPLLSEGILFTPDLDAASPDEIPGSGKEVADPSTAANAWYDQFSRAFAQHRKTPEDTSITAKLAQQSINIQEGIKSGQQKRLWWVATAVFSGLQTGAIENNISLQSLFQRLALSLDELKQGKINKQQTEALTTSLLYYLALAKSGNPQVDKIRKLYQLETLVVPADELDRVRSGISGHNRKLYDSVSAAISDEFEIIKTRMAELEEGTAADDEDQIPLDALTVRLADTLSVLGLQQSAETLHQSSQILAKAREAGKPPTDEDLVQIAGDIISIENSLDRHVTTLGSARESQSASSATPQLPAHELWQMIGKLLGECLTLLTSIKDQINDWLSGELSADNYATINQDFEQLVGALNLASHQPATEATRRLMVITAGMLEQKELPPEDIKELFADAFAALEMFLAAARDQQPQSGNLLELMLQRLDLLESGPDATTKVADLPTPEPIKAPTVVTKPLVDEDILEIFMEEYDEVYATLESALPKWLTDTDNTDARTDLQRGFHTLKGSGRMVGADEIGEFSWKIEMLLNQVIEGERQADNNTLKAVAVASAMLPAMKDRLQGDTSTIEPQLLSEFSKLLDQLAAEHAGTGEKLNAFIEELPTEFRHWLSDTLSPSAEPALDPELAQLIREEVVEHLNTLREWLSGATPSIPGDEPIRAAHTIAGTMALVPGKNEDNLESKLAHELESLLNRCQTGEVEFKKTSTETVSKVIAQINNRLKTLEQVAEPNTVKDHPLVQSLAQLNKDVHNEILARTEAVKAAAQKAAAEKVAAEKAAAERATAEKVAAERAVAEKAAAEKVVAEKAAAEKVVAEKAAAEKVAAEKATAEKAATERAAAEKAAAERAAAEKVAAEKAAAERAAAERATAERAAAERATAEKATTEKAAAERAAAERAAAEKAATERAAAEKAAAEKAATERAAAERAAAEKVAAEKAAAERAAAERATAEKATTEKAAAERAAAERAAAEKAATERAAAERAAAEKAATERAAAERAAAEKAAAERAAAERAAAEKATAERATAEKATTEKAAAEKAAAEKVATEKAAAEASSFDEEMAEIFIEEAREVLERTDGILHNWRSDLANQNTVNSLKREIHTLKGSSLMAGMPSVGGLSHVMETLLEKLSEKRLIITESIVAGLEVGCDNIHTMVESISKGKQPSDKEMKGYISAIEQLEKTSAKTKTVTIAKPDKTPVEKQKIEVPRALVIPALPEQPRTIQVMPENIETNETQEGTVRVNAALLSELINFAGEISIYRSRLDQEIGGFRNNLTEVNQTITRLRDQLRKMDIETETQILSRFQRETDYSETEFDPLELDRFSTIQQLSRALAESVADLTSLEEDLDNTARISETLLLQQSRVNTEMHEGLMQTRMVHFGTIAPRLRRLVRQVSKDTNKKAGLTLQLADNSEGMLDRDVLEKITAPLEHIIRNAIAHGIENPAQRKKHKKAAQGKITITVENEATELLITVEDDGGGINLEQIRKQAIKRGMLNQSEKVSDAHLLQFIMESGFTTAKELTDIAGRGIGMDVVNTEIKAVGGSLDINTEKNKGSRFRLRIPFTLAVMQAINITAGERDYAIPLASVRGVAKLSPEDYHQRLESDNPSYDFAGERYHLLELEKVLGFASTPVEGENVALLMIRTGNLRAAFRVNNLQSHHEVVIKPVGQQVASISGILGGTITGDGEVLIVLDMGPLIRLGISLASQRPEDIIEVAPEIEEKRAPLILVVDDSITMRKITSRVLENAEMEVFTAKDGLDAIEQMMDRIPDLIVLDIEMPRMDGYELATHIRADAQLREMPLIMITSRSGQKHRDRAAEIGVNRYMAKPYQESEMVNNVTELLEQSKKS